MPSPLPLELIEAIVDEVGLSGDVPTLMACALVSWAFTALAQRHLFRKVDFERRSPRKHYQRFYKLLKAQPRLGSYVRDIHLVDDSDDEGRSLFMTCGTQSWILGSKAHISQLLELLTNVERFALTFGPDMTDWKSIPEKTRTTLESVFRLPTLQAIRLEFVHNLPPDVLFAIARVPEVFLSCVEVAPIPFSPPRNLVGSRLRSLFLRGTPGPTIDVIVQSLKQCEATLESFSITPTYENGFCQSANEVVRRTGPSLRKFQWIPSVHFAIPSSPIDLGNAPNLTSLRFLISFRRTHANRSFSEAVCLLSQIGCPSKIEEITLDCFCIGRKMESRSFSAGWEEVASALERDAFASLRQLRITMSQGDNHGIQEKCTGFFDYVFAALRRRGVEVDIASRDEILGTSSAY